MNWRASVFTFELKGHSAKLPSTSKQKWPFTAVHQGAGLGWSRVGRCLQDTTPLYPVPAAKVIGTPIAQDRTAEPRQSLATLLTMSAIFLLPKEQSW